MPADPDAGVVEDPEVINWDMSYDIGAYQTEKGKATLVHGPWVPAGAVKTSDAYKNAFSLGKDEDGNWVASCSAIRLIGDIPKSVYTTSSLRYGWDEVPNFKDIPAEFKVTASVSVYNSEGSFVKGLNGSEQPRDGAWVNSYSLGSSLSAAAAGLALIASMMF